MSPTMSPTMSQTMSPQELHPFSLTLTPSLLGPLLLGPVALGLLIYIYAFCSQRQKRRAFGRSLLMSITRKEKELRGVQNTHVCLFSLLILDALTAIFGITLGIMTLSHDYPGNAWFIIQTIWFVFRNLSLSQHLIMALISVLFLYRPTWGSGFRIASKVLNVPSVVLIIVALQVNHVAWIGFEIYTLLLMLAIVVSCLLNTSLTSAKGRKTFGLLAAFTYVSVCLPNSVLYFITLHSHDYILISAVVMFATNFYFILDALLFYFVLKINEDEQQEYEGAIRCD